MAKVQKNFKKLLTDGGHNQDALLALSEFIINKNDRIAQMILMPVLKVNFEEVSDLPETVRGSGGFGSTGK